MITAVKIAIIAVLLILCVSVYPYLTPQAIGAFVRENSVSAPLLFIGICAVRPLLFFLPSMGLTIVAGVLFGAEWGTVYVVAGGALSTAVGYFFARWIGREAVEKLVRRSALLRQFEAGAREHGLKAVLSMRLFNLPWDLVSYWAGLHGITFRDFYLASLIPLVPVSFLYVYFGSTVYTPLSAGFIISLLAIFGMGALPHIVPRLKDRLRG